MVNELLDLSRIESGGTLQMADGVDMSRLAADSAERLRLFGERQGVTFLFETPPGLPPVRGDATRLGQVVVNLVHNAVKFSPEGGEVRVAVRRDGDRALSSVTDHGMGIAKPDRARVRGGGTGLGLSIARHVVRGHGGRIWVESVQGTGSTFVFEVPLATDDRPFPSATGQPDVTSPGAAPDPARLRADAPAATGA
jgi:two-component system phosphate regulon sensor histidine kinase PhoR